VNIRWVLTRHDEQRTRPLQRRSILRLLENNQNISPNVTELKKITERKLSVDEVAEAIGVYRRTVTRLLDSGKLGYYQVGDRRIVGASHLQLYLSQTCSLLHGRSFPHALPVRFRTTPGSVYWKKYRDANVTFGTCPNRFVHARPRARC
jgi:excisionase family DNA binding protein